DAAFIRPQGRAEVMTRQEVRSVVLGKLLGPTDPGDTAWDIGAGLGTVAIEVAVLRPYLEVVAVEQDKRRPGEMDTVQGRIEPPLARTHLFSFGLGALCG